MTIDMQCSAPLGLPITYTIAQGPAHGTIGAVDQATGGVSYTPAPGFNGTDTLTYTATGPGGTSAAATATITVPAPPVQTPGSQTPSTTPSAPPCIVPRMNNRSLAAAARLLKLAHCSLGHVFRPHTRNGNRPPKRLVVIRQGIVPGTRRASGGSVNLWLGPPPPPHRRYH